MKIILSAALTLGVLGGSFATRMIPAAAPVAAAPETDCTKKCDHQGNKPEEGAVEALALQNPSDAPSRGPSTAKVTVVAWSDFQCPYCARGSMTLRELSSRYGDRIRLVFRNQPLPMHDRAKEAAAAALAANDQGKFWEYHDALFAHPDQLDRASLERRAQELGLDVIRFRASMDSQRTKDRLSADLADAQRLGVTGTPTFFVNGRRITGAQPVDTFATAIDAELAR
jgi:protein-disulfide isomerase